MDVLVIAPKEQLKPLLELGRQGGELHKKYRVYLDYVGVARVPEDYESRLTEMFPKAYKRLRLCALDPYDLALSKLERNIDRDRDDVKHLALSVPLDLHTLKERTAKEKGGTATVDSSQPKEKREDLTPRQGPDRIGIFDRGRRRTQRPGHPSRLRVNREHGERTAAFQGQVNRDCSAGKKKVRRETKKPARCRRCKMKSPVQRPGRTFLQKNP